MFKQGLHLDEQQQQRRQKAAESYWADLIGVASALSGPYNGPQCPGSHGSRYWPPYTCCPVATRRPHR